MRARVAYLLVFQNTHRSDRYHGRCVAVELFAKASPVAGMVALFWPVPIAFSLLIVLVSLKDTPD